MRLLKDAIPGAAMAQFYACLALVAASAAAMAAGGWSQTPVSLRFLAGLASFGYAPGFLAMAALPMHQKQRSDPVLSMLSAVSLSFSFNFIINIVLFIGGWSLHRLSVWYLFLQLAAYLAVACGMLLRRDWFPALRGKAREAWDSFGLGMGLVLAAGFLLVLLRVYRNGAPLSNPEELIVLRKLAENPSIRFDNISSFVGEPSTYLFVPFQVFIAGTSVVSGLDVSLVYSTFWALTTALSIVCVVKLASVVFGDAKTSSIMAAVALAVVVFDPTRVIYDIAILAPYPNRYGFSAGVLIPLNLLMFWLIIKEERLPLVLMGLLVYLSVEMTFVHARETLFVLGCMGVAAALTTLDARVRSASLWRILTVIAATGAVLAAYKVANLALSSQLSGYVGPLTQKTREALAALVRERGILAALWATGPSDISMTIGPTSMPFVTHVASYREIFVASWGANSRIVLPIVLLCLPVYCWAASSLIELILAASITTAALVSLSGLVKLLASSLVGNPEILHSHGIVYLLAFILLAHMAGRTLSFLSRLAAGRMAPLKLLAGWSLVAAGLALLAMAVLRLGPRWGVGSAFALHGLTLAVAVWRASSAGLPLFPPESRWQDLGNGDRALLVLTLAGLLAACWPMKRAALRQWHPSRYPPSAFSGRFADDAALLIKSGRTCGGLPVGLLRFFREGMPPNQTVFGSNTFAVVANAPHFAAVLNTPEAISTSFISNWRYLERHQVKGKPFSPLNHLDRKNGHAALKDLLVDLKVDAVFIGPPESAAMARELRNDASLRQLLRTVHDEEGYLVLRTTAAYSQGNPGLIP